MSFSLGWSHSANGVTPNGTTDIANTHLVPSIELTNNDTHFGFYSRTDAAITGRDMGSWDTASNKRMSIQLRWTTSLAADQYQTPDGRVSVTNPNSDADFISNRTTASVHKVFKNGVQLGSTNTGASGDLTSLGSSIYLGAVNRDGSTTNPSSRQRAFDSIGDGLTDAEVLSFYNIKQEFQTTLGREVLDTDAQAWIDKMTSPTQTEIKAINTFVIADKASGNWALRDDIWVRSLGSVNGLVGKNKTGTATAGIGWSINGASYNGTTHYIDNNFDLTSDGVNYGLNDAQLGFFMKTSSIKTSGVNCVMGVYDGLGYSQILESPASTAIDFYINKNSAGTSTQNLLDNTQYEGVFSTGVRKCYKDGVDFTSNAQVPTPVMATGYSIYEGARNNQGTADIFIDVEISISYISAAVGFDHAANNTDIRQLLTDLGVTL